MSPEGLEKFMYVADRMYTVYNYGMIEHVRLLKEPSVSGCQSRGGGGGVLWEFLGGDVPLGPWSP